MKRITNNFFTRNACAKYKCLYLPVAYKSVEFCPCNVVEVIVFDEASA